MTCKGKENERKKGRGQALPLLAPVSDCYPPHNSHPLFFQDVCLSLQWLLYISIVVSFLRLISDLKPDVLVQIKKEIPPVLLSRD